MGEDAATVAVRRALLARQANQVTATARVVLIACYVGFVAALLTTGMQLVNKLRQWQHFKRALLISF